MSTSQQIERARGILNDALSGVQSELAKCLVGQPAVDSERNLRWIVSSIEEMLTTLENASRPESPGLWRVVTDTWPPKSELRRKVIDAESAYEQLK